MRFIFWILAIAALILLFPIPIKLTLIFEDGIFTVKFYNITVIPSSRKKKNKTSREKIKRKSKTPLKKKAKKFKVRDLKDMIHFLANSKLKIILWTDFMISYSIEDAAVNAVAYGLLNQLSAFLNAVLRIFFRLKKYDCRISMKYNENFFNFKSCSIILFNLATIIYIAGNIIYVYFSRRLKASRFNIT